MAKRLKNRILKDHYLTTFQKLIISMHLYLTFQIGFNNIFQKIYHTMKIFSILNTNEEKPLKILKIH